MKSAFCLSGLSRAIPITYHWIKKYYLDPYNADVYFRSWSNTGIEGDYSPIRAIELYKPIRWELEYFDEQAYIAKTLALCEGNQDRIDKTLAANRHRVLAMWYNIQKCYELIVPDISKYDIVFRGRPDGYYITKFDFNTFERDTLYILGSKFNDAFAAGTPEVMGHFCRTYSRLYDFLSIYDTLPGKYWLCPHTLLEATLQRIEKFGFKVVRLKDNIRAGKIWGQPILDLDTDINVMIKYYEDEYHKEMKNE
jgi:hypothetical protein